MFDFEEKKLCFKFNGKEQEIDYPTVKMVNKFRKNLKGGSDEVDETISFLCNLGADKEVVENLRISQLEKLIEELTQELHGSKKN